MNKPKNPNKLTKGFTLTEMLVFTAISAIVMVVLLSILMDFLRTRERAKKLSALQDVAVYIFNDLTQEIHWSDSIEPEDFTSGHILTLVKEEQPPVRYEVIDKEFLKNGEPISLPEIKINSFTVTNQASLGDVPLLEIQLELQYPDPKIRILSEQSTMISLRKTTFETF